MSAAEVIELIKKLPPEEREAVFAFAAEARANGDERKVRYLSLSDAEKTAEKIFAENESLFRRLAQ